MYTIVDSLAPHSLVRNFTPVREFIKRSFAYSGVVAWNALPKEAKQAKDLNSFKKAC